MSHAFLELIKINLVPFPWLQVLSGVEHSVAFVSEVAFLFKERKKILMAAKPALQIVLKEMTVLRETSLTLSSLSWRRYVSTPENLQERQTREDDIQV